MVHEIAIYAEYKAYLENGQNVVENANVFTKLCIYPKQVAKIVLNGGNFSAGSFNTIKSRSQKASKPIREC